jgi:hypothetical protein
MKTKLKVELPLWWVKEDEPNRTKPAVGYTNGVTTYACSAEACYFVEVPEFEYEGYFKISDLTVIGTKRGAK